MMSASRKGPTVNTRRAIPGLDLRGPLTLGFVAAASLTGLIVAAVMMSISTGPVATAVGRVHAEPIPVRHADGGVIARMAVKVGDQIDAGAVLATFDQRLIDNQIAGLKRQMDGIQMHVGGLKQEAEALAATDRQSTQRQRLAGLEAQIGAAEQEVLGLQVRLTMAEQEKARSSLRAPFAGRVTKLAAMEAATVAPNGLVAELQPASDRLVLDAVWSRTRLNHVRVGQAISVWPSDAAPWSAALAGRIEQVNTDDQKTRLRVVVDLAGTDLLEGDQRSSDRAFLLQVPTGTSTLLSVFTSPAFQAPSAASRPVKVTP